MRDWRTKPAIRRGPGNCTSGGEKRLNESFAFSENGDLGLDNPKSSGIIITLSHLAAFLNHTDFLEQLWRSRLVGRGRMIGNHGEVA